MQHRSENRFIMQRCRTFSSFVKNARKMLAI